MTQETERYAVVLVTTGSRQEAEAIAESLIQANLAACVNLLPVFSIYTWQGTIQRDEEWQLLIKSERSRFNDLEAKIRDLHSYDVPEIIAVPIVVGSQPYLQWISSQVQE